MHLTRKKGFSLLKLLGLGAVWEDHFRRKWKVWAHPLRFSYGTHQRVHVKGSDGLPGPSQVPCLWAGVFWPVHGSESLPPLAEMNIDFTFPCGF